MYLLEQDDTVEESKSSRVLTPDELEKVSKAADRLHAVAKLDPEERSELETECARAMFKMINVIGYMGEDIALLKERQEKLFSHIHGALMIQNAYSWREGLPSDHQRHLFRTKSGEVYVGEYDAEKDCLLLEIGLTKASPDNFDGWCNLPNADE